VRVIPRISHGLRLQRLIELLHFRRAEPHFSCAAIFLEIAPPLGAGEGDDVVALVQQPCSAICPGVACFCVAISRTVAAARIFRSKFSPRNRGSPRRKSSSAYCSPGFAFPVRNPRPSGEDGTRPMPSSRSSGMMRGSKLRGSATDESIPGECFGSSAMTCPATSAGRGVGTSTPSPGVLRFTTPGMGAGLTSMPPLRIPVGGETCDSRW
jgi:hypothetical protein